MPLLLDTARSATTAEFRAANCITIGLINNMPDAALDATERQFIELLRAAPANAVVRLKLFSLPQFPRADNARSGTAGRYRDISELWETPLDGLIVTGAEPRAASLKDEPYWYALASVIDWARHSTASTVWSCLAAHAVVLHADGIERCALAQKRSGVFDCEAVAPHPLTKHAGRSLRTPHSRYNDLPEQALASSGYQVLTRSAAAGVDMFVKQERSLFVFFQGHPEYEADSLLREYRRDIGRFLKGECEHYPAMPQGYFDDDAAAIARAFQERSVHDRRADLIADFPMAALDFGLENTWRRPAVAVYETWIDYLRECKAERRKLSVPVRRSWRAGGLIGRVPQSADGSTR